MGVKAYNFFYVNKEYMTYDLTEDDYKNVMFQLGQKEVTPFIIVSQGAISTYDLRFVKEFIEEPEEENESATPPEYQMDDLLYRKSGEEDLDDDDGQPV